MTFTKVFAWGVKRRFEEENLTLHDMARMTKLPRTSLRRLMQGKGGVTLESAFKIAEALDSTIDAVALSGLKEEEEE